MWKMAPAAESHGRIILESDSYISNWRRKQAEKGIEVLFRNTSQFEIASIAICF